MEGFSVCWDGKAEARRGGRKIRRVTAETMSTRQTGGGDMIEMRSKVVTRGLKMTTLHPVKPNCDWLTAFDRISLHPDHNKMDVTDGEVYLREHHSHC